MKHYLKQLLIVALLYGGLLMFLLTTNPNKLSITWLIVPFVWLFLALFVSVQLLIDLLRLHNTSSSKRQLTIAAVCAAIPTLMLLLDSINQLTIKDSLLIVALGVGGMFYVGKIRLKKPSF